MTRRNGASANQREPISHCAQAIRTMVCHRVQRRAARPAVRLLRGDKFWPFSTVTRAALERDFAHLPLEREEVEQNKSVVPSEEVETVSYMHEKASDSSKNPLSGGQEPDHRWAVMVVGKKGRMPPSLGPAIEWAAFERWLLPNSLNGRMTVRWEGEKPAILSRSRATSLGTTFFLGSVI